ARHVGVALPGRVRLENFYVPAGGDIPDAGVNEKFAHKLQFFDEMINWSDQISAPSILVGDLNVAPLPEDVWDHKALLKVVSHTPIEVEKMDQLMGAHSWHDPVRAQAGDDAKLFSWWSYRARDWEASDRGRRLDHVWVSPSLKKAVQRTEVLKPVRGWEKPSDHAPIIADFEI
ncbi:MAG: endonuclease/exonuclease/phosphatase family protein, partial [Pseudomonadota bacterium]